MVKSEDFSFLIVAGGSGSRIGGLGKQFRSLGEGKKPLWSWSVDLALSAGAGEIVLVLPAGYGTDEISIPSPVKVAFGGATRTESVRNGLAASSRDYVMVHDAARPFASVDLLRRLMESVSPTVGAVPVMPVSEALKSICEDGVRAVDRDGLYATQTPQVFFREMLLKILSERGAAFKDEAEAWLDAGLELRCVEGERLNFKVTWPDDLELAEALVEKREKEKITGGCGMRVGIGYDVHRMTPERPLVLGGVVVPSPLGLLGHSDADVLSHAVADALLGAAGLPDIGNLFPANDEKYKGADSLELLRRVVELVKGRRWEIVWADAVLEAQVPRLNSYLPAMAEKLSAVLNPGLGSLCVNIKAKSPERTGDPGMAKSMTCRAVATLRK
ncbi:MAG: 2-C-methyl-D-erythritol 2,4-cyclodiphosphate synthase [Synergistaceae bacterium]|nr:2-C-methyl-D-erythritol 2,4-cyclodiphosphate synthase [Synergistaceae bacterium]